MARWLGMFAALLVWAGHFAGLYGLASFEAMFGRHAIVRSAGWAFSVLCVAVCLILLAAALRRVRAGGAGGFEAKLAGGSAVLAVVAIGWQALVLNY